MTGALINLPAVLLILVLSIFLIVGVRASATFNGFMVLIKTGVVILVILFGLSYVHVSNLTPFIPPNQGTFGKFGVSGILAASGMIFFAYIGFEAVSVAAQEARNPRRDHSRRHIGIAADLHRALHSDGRGADRHHRLAHAGCSQSGVVRRGENRGAQLAGAAHRYRPRSWGSRR